MFFSSKKSSESPRPACLASSAPSNRDVMPERWALTANQFRIITDCCRKTIRWMETKRQMGLVNLYNMNDSFVISWTRGTGASVALLMNPVRPLTADLMMSHAWSEDMDECQSALDEWLVMHQKHANVAVWFCLYANYQAGAEPGDVGPTVAEQLKLEPFKRVIHAVKNSLGMVVIHTTTAELYQRLWCVHEIDEAVTLGVAVSGAASFEYMAHKFIDMESADVDTAHAVCGAPADTEMIRAVVESRGGFERLNEVISEFRHHMVEELYIWDRARHFEDLHEYAEEEKKRVYNRHKALSPNRRRKRDDTESSVGMDMGRVLSEKLRAKTHVMHIKTFLQLHTLHVHEVCKSKGMLTHWESGMQDYVFISHSWFGNSHPDPHGMKFEMLTTICRKIIDERMSARPEWTCDLVYGHKASISAKTLHNDLADGFLWLDYFSVPQADAVERKRSIDSVPIFVALAKYFFVLVPAAYHESGAYRNYNSWSARGWCRMERLANMLSPEPKIPIFIESSNFAFFAPYFNYWIEEPVHGGSFAFQADKKALTVVISGLIHTRRALALRNGEHNKYRLLVALEHTCLMPTPLAETRDNATHSASAADLKAWLHHMNFASASEYGCNGWTPLRFAIYEGRLDIARTLLAGKADVEAPIKADDHEFSWHEKGDTILLQACRLRDNASIIDFLLNYRADPWTNAGVGNAAHRAALSGHFDAFEVLVDRHPDLLESKNMLGATPFNVAVIFGKNVNFLRQAAEKYGQQYLMINMPCGCFGMGIHQMCLLHCVAAPDTLAMLLDARADVNRVLSEQDMHPGVPGRTAARLMQGVSHLIPVSYEPRPFIVVLSNLGGSSALMLAAFFGRYLEAEMLLHRRADASLRNGYGRTALHFAALAGNERIYELIQREQPLPDIKDCWGLTARDWMATRTGSEGAPLKCLPLCGSERDHDTDDSGSDDGEDSSLGSSRVSQSS